MLIRQTNFPGWRGGGGIAKFDPNLGIKFFLFVCQIKFLIFCFYQVVIWNKYLCLHIFWLMWYSWFYETLCNEHYRMYTNWCIKVMPNLKEATCTAASFHLVIYLRQNFVILLFIVGTCFEKGKFWFIKQKNSKL